MTTINVIVHEMCVNNTLSRGMYGVQKEIRKIKEGTQGKDWFLVDNFPADLPGGLPPPEEGLQVRVCGAFYGGEKLPGCVGSQLAALQEKGYSAEVYMPATIESKNQII